MVRIMPYRTLENMIDGVVITFTDITISRALEAKLRETLALYQAPFERIGEGIIFQNAGGDITFVNAAAERILGFPASGCRSARPLISSRRPFMRMGRPSPRKAVPQWSPLPRVHPWRMC